MHEYTISNHDRKIIYFFIAAVSGLLGIGVTFTLGYFSKLFGFVVAAPSGLAIFGLVFILFDKFIWKLPFMYSWGFIKVPNLNGSWGAVMKSAVEGGQEIHATLNIHQTYSKIRIRLETDKSNSFSMMASFEMADPKYFKLRYEYLAEYQRNINSEVLRHYGVTNISLKSDNEKFDKKQSANYYTEHARDSNGLIELIKNEDIK